MFGCIFYVGERNPLDILFTFSTFGLTSDIKIMTCNVIGKPSLIESRFIEKHIHTVPWNQMSFEIKHLILHSSDDWRFKMLPKIAYQWKELLSYVHFWDFNRSLPMKWITNAVSPLVCVCVCFSLSRWSFFPKVIKRSESTGCEQRCQRWTLFAVGTRITRGRLSLMSLE